MNIMLKEHSEIWRMSSCFRFHRNNHIFSPSFSNLKSSDFSIVLLGNFSQNKDLLGGHYLLEHFTSYLYSTDEHGKIHSIYSLSEFPYHFLVSASNTVQLKFALGLNIVIIVGLGESYWE